MWWRSWLVAARGCRSRQRYFTGNDALRTRLGIAGNVGPFAVVARGNVPPLPPSLVAKREDVSPKFAFVIDIPASIARPNGPPNGLTSATSTRSVHGPTAEFSTPNNLVKAGRLGGTGTANPTIGV